MTRLKQCEFRSRRTSDGDRLDNWLAAQASGDAAGIQSPIREASWCAWREGEPQVHVGVSTVQVYWNGKPQNVTCFRRLVPTDIEDDLLNKLLTIVLHHLDRSSPQSSVSFFRPPPGLAPQFISIHHEVRRLYRSEWHKIPRACRCVKQPELTPAVRRAVEDLYLFAANNWDGALYRDAVYWRRWTEFSLRRRDEIVLMEPDDHGYARLRQNERRRSIEVTEIAAANAWHDLVVLNGIVSEASYIGAEWLELRLPASHGLWDSLASLGCDLQLCDSVQNQIYLRPPLGRADLLPGLLRRFRWNAADWF